MSDQTIDILKSGHTEVGGNVCGIDDDPWPCDTGVVLEQLAAAEARAQKAATIADTIIRANAESIADLEDERDAADSLARALRRDVQALTAERDAFRATVERQAEQLANAYGLLDYVRPILAEAYGERGRVHDLNFQTAVGDALDLIDTQERAEQPASPAGHEL